MLVVVELEYNDSIFEKKNMITFETEAKARDYCFEQIYDLYAEEVWPYLEDDDKFYNDPKQQLQLGRETFFQSKSWDIGSGNDGLYSYIDLAIDWGKVLIVVDIDT